MAGARSAEFPVTTALVVGVGEVGVRAARQLVDTPGIDKVLVADRDRRRASRLAESLGARAGVIDVPEAALPDAVDVVVCALPRGVDAHFVALAIDARVPVATSDDDVDAIAAVQALDERARRAGVTVAVGCGLAPGLSDALARHAGDAFEAVHEIRVARTGWGGPACQASARRARREPAIEWHDGQWRDDQPSGEQLVWFPEPIGARDCSAVAAGVRTLVAAFPAVPRVSFVLGEPPKRSFMRRRFGDDGEWGATRVEVWGRSARGQDCIVYGVVERTSVAAGTVLAVVAAHLAGALGDQVVLPGVHGVAELVEPVGFLTELSQRGVRAAVFEGVPVA
ncbi:MAG: Saccharopine dehydrogenase [Actinomycetia bacterium]|nr:Saccharopine dehydrogenase [Actinomycetes bacterium]